MNALKKKKQMMQNLDSFKSRVLTIERENNEEVKRLLEENKGLRNQLQLQKHYTPSKKGDIGASVSTNNPYLSKKIQDVSNIVYIHICMYVMYVCITLHTHLYL